MKYWSCCQRKTSDFDSFLNQSGCTEGNHLWFKNEVHWTFCVEFQIESFFFNRMGHFLKESGEKVNCRHDFHQTGGFVVLTIYSKNAVPDKTTIKANTISLDINASFEGGTKSFVKQLNLFGVFDVYFVFLWQQMI